MLLKCDQLSNKLDTLFHKEPFEVMSKTGSKVPVQSTAGMQYDHNSSHVKCYYPPDRGNTSMGLLVVLRSSSTGSPTPTLETKVVSPTRTPKPATPAVEHNVRSKRAIKLSTRFSGFEM